MAYDRVRKEHATALGVQVKVLDDQVRAARQDRRSADTLPFPERVPADEPVDLAVLLDEIVAVLRRYIVLDLEQAYAAALWTLHTYLPEVFEVSPILVINAPEKACGKTLLQTLIGSMSDRPMFAANASTSAIFRGIELWRPTLFFDEADTFFAANPDLHGLVNAGHKRGGCVLRTEAKGDSFEPRSFAVYCAKCIAGIGLERHLPETTMSRGIVLNLRRKLPDEKVERLRYADPTLFERIASKAARFALDRAGEIRQARPALPEALSDRAQDNWDGLIAIAQCAGQVWIDRAVAAALKLSGSRESSVSIGNELLSDIRDLLTTRPASKISTADLLAALLEDDERPWATYNRGKPISPRQLAKLLRGYGIKSKTIRLGRNNTPKGFERADFVDAFARYLPDEARPPQLSDESESDSRDDNVY